MTAVLIPGQNPPKAKYFQVTITILISTPTHPTKVKYQNTMQTVNQAAWKLQDHHHQSGNLTTRTLYLPLPEMAIVHRSMHDAIHAVREHGRAVTRSLLTQQRTLAVKKLQCNAQIKRTSTPDPPSMSNVPPRRARARSAKANGVTSGSSEESDCEPQTARNARFEALKR